MARLAADPMAVSSQDENSGSSFAEGASGRRKKSSKRKHLMLYYSLKVHNVFLRLLGYISKRLG